jgi:hypothetical protein
VAFFHSSRVLSSERTRPSAEDIRRLRHLHGYECFDSLWNQDARRIVETLEDAAVPKFIDAASGCEQEKCIPRHTTNRCGEFMRSLMKNDDSIERTE